MSWSMDGSHRPIRAAPSTRSENHAIRTSQSQTIGRPSMTASRVVAIPPSACFRQRNSASSAIPTAAATSRLLTSTAGA